MEKIIVYGILVEILFLISLLVLPFELLIIAVVSLIVSVRKMEAELNDEALKPLRKRHIIL